MFGVYCSNSIIHLKNGTVIYCENLVSDVREKLKISNHPEDTLLLFPSTLKGESISVYIKDILKCEYTD
jgi:hypothetical protein